MKDLDVVIVGAGAAGIGAGLRLAEAGVSFRMIEARDRLGGRAHTVAGPGGVGLDLGCGWLHDAARNPWVARFEGLGLAIDRSDPPWGKPQVEANFPLAEQRSWRAAFDGLEGRLAEAAQRSDDEAASASMEPGGRWNALLDAFSGYYNGAAFSRISVHDYAAYDEGEANWRVPVGYGAAIARAGASLPVTLGAAVTVVRHDGSRVRVETTAGALEAAAAILTLPSDLIAAEAVRLFPALPHKVDAAGGLPLGCAAKLFLEVDQPDALPLERNAFGRTDTARTGAYHLRPLGRPVVEGYFGGEHAAELEAAGADALAAFALDELAGVFGANVRRILRPVAASAWSVDPLSRGAYSHARVGRAADRARLATPVGGRLFFAGEATSPHAFSTAHGAYESGVRAAEEALAALRP